MNLLFAGFGGCFVLLRNEASFGFALLGAKFQEIGEALVKGALVRGLVANIKRQLLRLVTVGPVATEGQILKPDGALGEPEVLGHALDEELFGWGVGLALAAETGEQFGELVLVFPVENKKDAAGETVTYGVLAGDCFPCFGARTGEVLRVLAIDFGAGGLGLRFGGLGGVVESFRQRYSYSCS